MGPAGVSGAQGAPGYAGAQGSTEMTGVPGATGATGSPGPQGAVGPTGAQGPMLAGANGWSPYRDYSFNVNSDQILGADGNKAREIADYLQQNPSQRVTIDGTNDRRVANVREALVNAGVPGYKIQTSSFGSPQQRRNDVVAVMVGN
jgi:hypothetical protein